MPNNIHGFVLQREQFLTEQKSVAKIYEHQKTGARLVHLANDDDNKVFSITFRTPARDSTGIAHILEHSVLGGSKKYPLKEPFVELVKGSLSTFVNAMTFPDKTMYPVASRNTKDFYNLMDVYLDAVLNPAIVNEPNIFKQEGWHYELSGPDSELKYNGVVYNEMKGAFSSPESVVERKIFETLFPEGPYGVESGGHPDSIPDLKSTQFCKFHAKYYHPSNSFIFLYGDMDIEKTLGLLDGEYLSQYDRQVVKSAIALQPAFEDEVTVCGEYPIGAETDCADKTFLTYNFVVGQSLDVQLMMALAALQSILLETPASPLKRALVEAGIGQEICGDFDSMILQPVFSIKAINANAKDADRFREIIHMTLTDLVDKGIDKKLIEATLNRKEFALREADFGSYPKGLIYNIAAMETWLYNGDPLAGLAYEQYLPQLRAALSSDYFEQLIKKYLLDNNHRALVIVQPNPGLDERNAEAVREKLRKYKAGLSEEQLQQLVRETQELKTWQARGDSDEDLEKIPVLAVEDLERKAEELPLEIRTESGVSVAFSNIFTNKIIYASLLFDMAAVPPEDFEYLNLLLAVLGKIDTSKRDFADLANEINIHTGGFTVSSAFISDYHNKERFCAKVSVRFKALRDQLPAAAEIVEELLYKTVFTNKKRLKEIVQELHADLELSLIEDGNSLASATMLSYLAPVGAYQARGLHPFYLFIKAVDKNFDKLFDSVAERLAELQKQLFVRRNLLVAVTCDETDYSYVAEVLNAVLPRMSDGSIVNYDYSTKADPRNEGLAIPSKVQYVFKGVNFAQLGYEFSGSMKVLDTLLSYDYLWTKIRIMGGAYGTFARFYPNGAMYFGSYRDPHLLQSLKAYDDATQYLRDFAVSDREMLKNIIGTLSRVDTPLSPAQKGQAALQDYLSGRKHADVQRERDELLATNQKTVRSYAKLFAKLSAANIICVVGGKEKLESHCEMFKTITTIIE
ncbi:MAG: insulinase family protein [Negativicutes bacterium]